MKPVLPVITSPGELEARLEARARAVGTDLADVHEILEQVREEGDRALRHFTQTYDGIDIEDPAVPWERLDQGRDALALELELSIQDAAANIRRFHERQRPEDFAFRQPDGTEVAWQWRPLRRVGVYVPGGRYPLLSTILMTVIPAQVAGVAEIAVCTPPGPSGYPADALLGTCALLGLDEVYRVGGAQAIAALAFGTESIAAADKIVGPGNRYVTAAKQAVSPQVGIDMLAGPTEVVILADESAESRWVAADLISQAEHDPLAWPVLLTTSRTVADEVNRQLDVLLEQLPTAKTAQAALSGQGFIYLGTDLDMLIQIANRMAPEHLCLQLAQAEKLVDRVQAGAVFVGTETPVAWGDYWAGPNHTLPTAGQARFRGPLSVLDFMVPTSVIKTDREVLRANETGVRMMADQEGLAAHALSIQLRME